MKEIFGGAWFLIVLVVLYIIHFPRRVNRLIWGIGARFTKFMLENNEEYMIKVVNFELYKKNFVTQYMADQGYSVPAVTKVVLKNNYQAIIGIHFFNPDHLVIDKENSTIKPVYSDNLLQIDYYLETDK